MSKAVNRPLRVFLCHAHADRSAVYTLYSHLKKDGADAWLDKEKLVPGAHWELEIRKAVHEADVVVVCHSKQFNQAGFRQKEVRLALETAMEKPEGEIFIIPACLEECDLLESLSKWHKVDLFESDGYQRLMSALRMRANKIGATLQENKEWTPSKTTTSYPKNEKPIAEDKPFEQGPQGLESERVPLQRVKDYSGVRWLVSCIFHISIIFLGLFTDNWLGILFISLPLFLVYYFVLYRLAIVLLPTSNPEDRTEKWKRFVILTSYTWGIQYPLIVVNEHAWKKPEVRIPGDFSRDFPITGLIWMRSHLVAAITDGNKLKRIDSPGVVFTGKLERPFQIFDLRLQVRTNEIDVVSKDGISFKARVVTAFRLDPETWDKETYEKLRRTNPILRGADKPSYTLGSFPFSQPRIQATLGVTSSKVAAGGSLIYWDQWALNVVEDMARKVISQKNLDELWYPAQDEKFANALDEIANELKANALPVLRSAGILAYSARVVNFGFPGEQGQVDDISKQQIATWCSEWERKSSKILAEAQAESEYAQQEARAYAEALTLNSITGALQIAQETHPELIKNFLSARRDRNQK